MPALRNVALSLFPPLKRLQEELRSLRRRAGEVEGSFTPDDNGQDLPPEFRDLPFASRALAKVISDYEFTTVLDLGSGAGAHASVFAKHGKVVTALDYGKSPYYEHRDPQIRTIVGDFNVYDFGRTTFDCVWASHVLEHQPNTNLFLQKIHSITRDGGVVAITVPPLKHRIVGGHVSLWNGGVLLYHLVLAGFDCSAARVRKYGYNISVILTKRPITVRDLTFDRGDLTRLKSYLPSSLRYFLDDEDSPFDGDISCLNW
jgi:SAM-dependent methyltransferase